MYQTDLMFVVRPSAFLLPASSLQLLANNLANGLTFRSHMQWTELASLARSTRLRARLITKYSPAVGLVSWRHAADPLMCATSTGVRAARHGR